ncbi:MAG: helix-turn-helix domain-containing protein [Peptococcaceae bacterium]|nr:helix-turn-helix domain-containing protein [Peptococcaceae bacterium]
MNRTVTSEEEILAAAQTLLLEKGAGALTMRSVAAACGVAVGSIYNYFPSKGALVGTTIESVWTDIFRPFTEAPAYASFADCAAALLAALAEGDARHPGFFSVHALSFAAGEKDAGRALMARCFSHLREKMLAALAADPQVRAGVFDGALSKEAFVNYVLQLAIMQQKRGSGEDAALLALICSCIY